jgi:hypothetical protein
MGAISDSTPALLILAAFSRHRAALDWARHRASAEWGAVALCSPDFLFSETDYYQASMGPDLRKQFLAFEPLIDPAALIDLKRQTNDWEDMCADQGSFPELRPLNLDPGYLTMAKLVLASTKDHAHRIYLGRGIYAEVTLSYKHRRWQDHAWTFPDYRRTDYQEFFTACREYLRKRGGTAG